MEKILGISFFNGTLEESINHTLKGGLVVVPSGPGLANDFVTVQTYRDAILGADTALTDSSVMVALYRLVSGSKVPRHSGLKFLKALLETPETKVPGASFWVMPGAKLGAAIESWLGTQGFTLRPEDSYIAPLYKVGEIEDEALLKRLETQKPRLVVLNIGGGTQEILGHWLIQRLSYRPTIICTGAAIGFLAGTQVHIPMWVDKAGLGWFWRTVSDPASYFPRYWNARGLIPLVLNYRDQLPPMKSSI